jgi:predicted negative regulator of RcsB-dependent stress response
MTIESTDSEAQVHLLAIRKALANRNAAVMVGAGFSRNAEGGEALATWRQLAEALAQELEPSRIMNDFSPASASQLAEQYSRVFSPTHLEQLIKRCVPDDQVTPGPLHKELIELPWAEIFTTNYDTLLEREAERMFDVSYFTVCSREDIPQSKVLGRRRIVKLHGSFPSHRPFILTEEDYRTYPERFAPFVNLVRQSLLENIFCLIGFSGDDPNFLHWLGWVRDMLDKHALPVYLFLSKTPTLGERKLYEARGVVPVILPMPEGIEPSNYKARYCALFSELAKPLSNSPLDWGDIKYSQEPPTNPGDNEESFKHFIAQLPALVNSRQIYPGWIIAPAQVRARIKGTANWLERKLENNWLRTRLSSLPAPVIISVLDLYCWMQQAVLGPLSDNIAELGIQSITAEQLTSTTDLTDEAQQILASMQADSPVARRKMWTNTALALLTWARQAHRTTQYEKTQAQLETYANSDAVIKDRLIYEEVLRSLQQADRPAALAMVSAWRPSSSDAYVHVLRGTLLAEVGDTAVAVPIVEHAIQTLRRQQRSRPNDPALVSREAWACLVAGDIQRVLDFNLRFGVNTESVPTTDSRRPENFDLRLSALVARGYSARAELDAAEAKLNAEALPPKTSHRRKVEFDLGSYSNQIRFGAPAELSAKISASFAWLELVERVGLPPIIGGSGFYSDQLLHAAWWARYADRPERSTGLLLRANQHKALEPRDPSIPPHRTGWLQRHEIATFREDAAAELSEELLQQIVVDFDSPRVATRSERRTKFLLEAFGRLVTRVEREELLLGWGQKLLLTYSKALFQSSPLIWAASNEAISRLLDSLAEEFQRKFLLNVFQLPLAPVYANTIREHELENWTNLEIMTRNCAVDLCSSTVNEWKDVADSLIQKLRTPRREDPIPQIWVRLSIMNRLGALTKKNARDIGNFLWSHAPDDQWPTIPGHYVGASLNWPSPHRDVAKQLVIRLLIRPLRPFSAGYMMVTLGNGGRTYHIGDLKSSILQLQYALGKTIPSLPQIKTLITRVEEWADFQLAEVAEDIHHDAVRESAESFVNSLDHMLSRCIQTLSSREQTKPVEKLIRRISTIDVRLRTLPFVRSQLKLSLIRSDERELAVIDDEVRSIIRALTSVDENDSRKAFSAAYLLLQDEHPPFQSYGRKVFDAIVACIFSPRTPSIFNALELMARLPHAALRSYVDEKSLLLLDTALAHLAYRLDYGNEAPDDSIPVEAVPLARFRTIELAHTLVHAGFESTSARRWLENATSDPLPEIRLGRYRIASM